MRRFRCRASRVRREEADELSDYRARYVIRPRVRSYGESSTVTLSPGKIRMKNLRILPLTWAKTRWPFSSSTRNIALGSGSTTVPSTDMPSSLATRFSLVVTARRSVAMTAKFASHLLIFFVITGHSDDLAGRVCLVLLLICSQNTTK